MVQRSFGVHDEELLFYALSDLKLRHIIVSSHANMSTTPITRKRRGSRSFMTNTAKTWYCTAHTS